MVGISVKTPLCHADKDKHSLSGVHRCHGNAHYFKNSLCLHAVTVKITVNNYIILSVNESRLANLGSCFQICLDCAYHRPTCNKGVFFTESFTT